MENLMEKHCQEAQGFIKQLALHLGEPEELNHAMRVLRSVMHTIRGRITPEESMHLIAQLPVILKGIYVDGWKITQPLSGSQSIAEFLTDLRSADRAAGADFSGDEAAKTKIRATFNALRQYIDDGEMQHLFTELPAEIADVIIA